MQSKTNFLTRHIGAHVSAAGGLENAIIAAHDIGANCAQVFSGSPRVWVRKSLDSLDLSKYYSKRAELKVEPIFTHSLYLVNLVSEKPDLQQKSINGLIYDLKFDSLIKGSGVVVHLGSHQGRGWEAVREVLVKNIQAVLTATPEDSTFLIENSAGQNGKLCTNFVEIAWLIDQIGSPRLKWCFDTCHGFASGRDLAKVVDEMQSEGLLDKLACIHANDSRDEFASGRDRHANIGDGQIPPDQFATFLNDQRITHVPLILEVPGLDKKGRMQSMLRDSRRFVFHDLSM